MKKITISLLFMFAVISVVFSQVPASFNYQAVVRNSSGEIVANKTVSFRISLLKDSETGSVIYSEEHKLSTNEFGLVNLKIGKGTKLSGNFSPASWGDIIFTKIEFDPAGGSSFSELATTKLSSVPYAFIAQSVVNDKVDDADADPKNEIQTLKLTGNLLELSNGGGEVTLPSSGGGGGGDNWGAQVVKTDATLTGNGTSINPLSVVPDGDGDDTNELQTLSRSGDKIELSNGGGSVTDEVDDADADPSNEIQTISLDGTLLKLSNGGGEVTLPSSGGGGGDNWGAQVVNTDGTLTGDGTSANPLSVVPDGDGDDSNELQTLSLSGNNLRISDGNTITIPDNSKWVSDDNGIVNYEGYDHVGINMPSDKDISLIVNSRSNGALKVINNSGVSYPLYAENAYAGGAAAMFKNKIVIQDGNQAVGKVLTSDDNGVATWQTPAAGGSSLWTESGSNIYRSSGKVGIGSSSFGSIKLDVETSEDWIAIKGVNNSDNYGALYLQNLGGGPAADIRGEVVIKDGTQGAGKVLTSDANGSASWQTPASGLWTESGSDIYRSSGKVGIGTTAPSSPLEIKSDAINALIIGSATSNGANRPGIQFKNNTMQYFSGDDGSDEIFGFLSKWGSTRAHDAVLRVYGAASSNWGKYIQLTHNGYDGFISTDVGDIDITPNGNVGIKTNAPTATLDVNGTVRFRGITSGSETTAIVIDGDGNLHSKSSDRRLKENIHSLNNGLDKVLKLRGVTFTWKANPEYGTRIGFIAQEFEKVVPELAFTNPVDGYKGINYAEVTAVLVEAIKEQQKIIDAMKTENIQLKASNDQIVSRLEKLESLLSVSAQK